MQPHMNMRGLRCCAPLLRAAQYRRVVPNMLATYARGFAVDSGRDDSTAQERREGKTRNYDATATKPSAICDPYENKGEPLSASQCAQFMRTVSDKWTLTENHAALVRELEVDNFMKGAKILTTLAAVAFNDGHFPLLTLERRIGRGKRWQEVVVVKCQTVVLGGLSYRDFQLALLMDIELEKPT